MKKNTQFMTQAAMIAALYVVLVIAFAPISFGAVQVRIAEMLSVLPFFTPAAVPGLFIGCLIGNIVGGADLLDIIFGSLTTLAAAAAAYRLRSRRYLTPIPAVIFNALVIPFILRYAYQMQDAIYFMMVTVFIGQVISAYVLGMLLLLTLEKIGFARYLRLEQTMKGES